MFGSVRVSRVHLRDSSTKIPSSDFASNVGITFKTPEEFFFDEAPQAFARDFEPVTYLDGTSSKAAIPSKLHSTGCPAPSDEPAVPAVLTKNSISDIVLLCGSPGAGNPPFHSLSTVTAQMCRASESGQRPSQFDGSGVKAHLHVRRKIYLLLESLEITRLRACQPGSVENSTSSRHLRLTDAARIEVICLH